MPRRWASVWRPGMLGGLPGTGLCYFARFRLPPERLVLQSAAHPRGRFLVRRWPGVDQLSRPGSGARSSVHCPPAGRSRLRSAIHEWSRVLRLHPQSGGPERDALRFVVTYDDHYCDWFATHPVALDRASVRRYATLLSVARSPRSRVDVPKGRGRMSSGPESYMPKQEVKHPDRAASTGAYSDGVILDGWLYISGQGPLDLTQARRSPGASKRKPGSPCLISAGFCKRRDAGSTTWSNAPAI